MGLNGWWKDEAEAYPTVRSSQHLWFAIDLSWSGPRRGEVIVVKVKEKKNDPNMFTVPGLGLFALHSISHPSPALPCSASQRASSAGAFSRLLCERASAWHGWHRISDRHWQWRMRIREAVSPLCSPCHTQPPTAAGSPPWLQLPLVRLTVAPLLLPHPSSWTSAHIAFLFPA